MNDTIFKFGIRNCAYLIRLAHLNKEWVVRVIILNSNVTIIISHILKNNLEWGLEFNKI